MNNAAIINTITRFLTGIGIDIILRPISGLSFLPGLQMENGKLIIDTEKLLYPGDMLHEAGHLATMPPDVRQTMNDNLPATDLHQGGELMALCWSYAAALHLGLPPSIVFHADGYKGGSEKLIENFETGFYIGLSLLQWAGLAFDDKKAAENNEKPYPHMINWLRQA